MRQFATDSINSKFAVILLGRSQVYEMLRRLFLFGPTADLIAELIALASCYQEDEAHGCPVGERALIDFLKTLKLCSAEVLARKYKLEFTRLFIGPYHLSAPPYESAYRSAGHTLMQDITIEIRAKYYSAGLEVKKLNHEPDDHIGLEMEFMYYLNMKALEALNQGDLQGMLTALASQSRCLTGHLSQWVPTFCDDVAANTRQDFFRYLAGFLKEFIIEDCMQVRRLMQAGRELLADASQYK